MDEEYEHRGEEEAPHLTRKPSTFVHEGGNIFFGCEAEERMLGPTLDLIGHNTVMYASDWPHWDGDYPASLHEMPARGFERIATSWRVVRRGSSVLWMQLKNISRCKFV